MPSIWNSFKKKVNESWSGLDFYDEEENKRQRQQFAAARQPTPVDNGGGALRVMPAQQQQTITIDQPDYSNKMVTVAPPQAQPEIRMPNGTLPSQTRTPEQQLEYDVNTKLDYGKSWEDISRETKVPLANIKEYSQATRPNYGIVKPAYSKGIGGFFEKAGDKLEANSPQDIYERREQGAQEKYDGTKFWQKTRDLGVSAGREIVRIPETVQSSIAKSVDEDGANELDKALAEKDPEKRKAIVGKILDPDKNSFIQLRRNTHLDPNMSEEDLIKMRDRLRANQNASNQYTEGAKRYLYGSEPVKTYQQRGRGVREELKTGESAAQKYLKTKGEGGEEISENLARNAGPYAAFLATLGVGLDIVPDPSDLVKAPLKKGSKEAIESLVKTSVDDVAETAVRNSDILVKPGVKPTVKILDDIKPEAPSVFQAVNPATGEKIFKTIDPADFDAAKKAIDGGEAGIAGTKRADGFVPHITAKTPEQMEALGFKNMGKYETGVDDILAPTTNSVPIQGVTMPKPSSTQSIADLLPDLNLRPKVATTPLDDMKVKYNNLKPEVIDRLIRGYGEAKAANILARTSDATNIRDMNGFVISEARKAFGAPNVRMAARMSPEEEAALFASAPPVRVAPPPQTAPLRVEAPVEIPRAAPQAADIPVTPTVTPPTGKLGTMADEFYQSRQGNQAIKYRDLERLGQDISKQVDLEFKAIGTDYATVAAKVQEGARNGARTLDEAGLTPAEAAVMRNAQAEMNYVRRRASTGKREIGEGNYGEMYIPQQRPGQNGGENLFEGFRATKPGTENVRKNRIELEDLDYSPEVIGEYVTRYGDTKLYREERLARALAKNNPLVDEDTLADATRKLIEIQDKVNSVRTKIGAFGFGTRQQVDEAGKFVDTAADMTDLGKQLGHQIDEIDVDPKGLTNGDRINSVKIGNETLGDRLGLNQHRDAEVFASKQFVDSGGDREVLASMVEQRLREVYKLDDEAIEYATGGVSRIPQSVPDEVVLARVTSTYRQAAKQQLMEELQHVDIKNVKLRKDVSGLTNQILREGTIENELSAKVVSKILQTQNAVFRKLNVSSALNELSDLNSFISVYGRKTAILPDFSTIKEFGLGEIDAAIEPYLRQAAAGGSVPDILKSINSKTNLYKFVEAYKAGVVATSAKNMYSAKGLTGDALAKAVLNDYRTLALPVDAFTKTFLDNTPLYTQYMTWGLRNIQKEGRLATGKISSGVLEDMTTKQRIARNAYANLPAKTVFWLSMNGLKGTAILTAFGMTDFTGLTNQDYSGIAEEDKSWFDRTTQFTNSSTTLSMMNSIVQAYEKEQLKEKYKDADYNPYETTNFGKDVANKYTPQFIKNVTGTNDMLEKGYSENKAGRVQYEAPTDWWNTTKSYLFGKGQTDNAREYGGREAIWDREGNPVSNAVDMAKEQLGLKDTEYTRPLTETYSEAYKQADEGARTAMLEGGRQFNKYLDDLKRDNKPAYDNYISAMDGNHVNPEYWKTIAGGDSSKPDLANFNMIKNRKKQEAKDLGKKYDPLYDLTDEQARAVIQQKSVATGDDIALRNSLYKEKWYTDYQKKVKEFYDTKEETDSDYETTQRVRDWYDLNDQYNGIRTTVTDDGKEPEWAKTYPTVYQQKLVSAKYGFDSDESKAFFKANGDAYSAEKDAYDASQLAIINKMRAIEGYPAMSAEQFEQVSKVVDTDKSDDKKGGSGSDRVSIQTGDYGKTRALDLPSVKIQVAKQKRVAKYAPKTVKMKRSKAKM